MNQGTGVTGPRNSFVTSDVNPVSGQVGHPELMPIPKPPETPATQVAKQSYFGRAYLDWAQYPLVTEKPSGEDSIVYFRDLRFDYPPMRGRAVLSGSVELDRNLEAVAEQWGRR